MDSNVRFILTAQSGQAIASLKEVQDRLRGLGVSVEQFSRQGATASDRFASSLGGVKGILGTIGVAFSAAAVLQGLASMTTATIRLGVNAVESENLFTVSMGKMTAAATTWSKELSKGLGLNEFELRKSVGTFNVMFTAMGLNTKAAYDMATGLTKLAYDFASFYNLRPDEAFQKLQAGISGEVEPLRRLGIVVDELTVKTYAYAKGIAKQGEELTQQEKVLARYGVIMQQTSAAQGDLARTIESPANQMRILTTRVEEMGTKLGIALLPALSATLTVLNKGLDAVVGLTSAFTNGQSAIDKWGGRVEALTSRLKDLKIAADGAQAAMFSRGFVPESLPNTGYAALLPPEARYKDTLDQMNQVRASLGKTTIVLDESLMKQGKYVEAWQKVRSELEKIPDTSKTAEVGLERLSISLKTGAVSITKAVDPKDVKKFSDEVNSLVDGFIKQNAITPVIAASIQRLYDRGVPAVELWEKWGKNLQTWGPQADSATRRILAIGAAMSSLDATRPLSDAKVPGLGRMQELMDFANSKYRNVELISAETGTQLDELTNASVWSKFKAEVDSIKLSFSGASLETTKTVRAVSELIGEGADLCEVYRQYGGLLETYPELLGEANIKALEMGKMQSVIKDGWINIGRTIERSIGGAFSDVLAGARSLQEGLKGVWNSIKRAFYDMVGDMVGSWVKNLLRPILSNAGSIFGGISSGTSATVGSVLTAVASPAIGGGGGTSSGLGTIAGALSGLGFNPFAASTNAATLGSGGGAGAAGGGGGSLSASAGGSGGGIGGLLGKLFGKGGGGASGSFLGALGGSALGLGASVGLSSMLSGNKGSLIGGGLGAAFFGGAALLGGAGASMFTLAALLGGAGVGAAAALAIIGLIKAFSKTPAQAAGKESMRDFGVNVSASTFEQFAGSLGLSEKQYKGIRKDLTSSPKYLTEVLFPQAKQSGNTDAFLRSLEHVTTAWNPTGYNFRPAFETWMKTGNSGPLNQAFIEAFSPSKELAKQLPDWQNVLSASGSGSASPFIRIRLPIAGGAATPGGSGGTGGGGTGGGGGGGGGGGDDDEKTGGDRRVEITVNGYYDEVGARKLFEQTLAPMIVDALERNSPVPHRSGGMKYTVRKALGVK